MSLKWPLIYLASQSARRRQILARMKIPFRVVASTYNEDSFHDADPVRLACVHAVGKACEARLPVRGRYVIGADTVVACRGRLLGKPGNEKEALEMLTLLSGRMNSVYTGICVFDRRTGRLFSGVDRTDVWIRRLSRAGVRDYIARTHPWDKAGGYAIQSGPRIVSRIRGSYSNVVGFPRSQVRALLKKALQGDA